ncbi:sulfite exporter TauE/SafE family protein [Muricoccus aerilatus]|uniref:sulfite exporter TauE/SafE family protein n=1 Tax=Muricoccus aerilatus TaxID=452982 RepID=UPI0005C17E14|nr:sulfite exporter TauE/SafE family protein [Roseomonas aerilata]
MAALLAVLCGGAVGFVLGLIGGGGSILATPLLLYVVGLPPHAAIGTGAVAVGVNAFANLAAHARGGQVRWGAAAIFAALGVAGAAVGSTVGKAVDGQRLLVLFAVLMVVVALLMLRPHTKKVLAPAGRAGAARLAGAGLGVGTLAGFFGIGGGFLIVPGLVHATGMPMVAAVGSSLLAVGAFGATTAVNYALSGLVDWPVAAEYVLGGVLGGWAGMRLCHALAPRRAALQRIFAGIVLIVAAYMLARSAGLSA